MIAVLMGVSAAGKSTVGALLALPLGWELLDADDLHAPASIEKMRRGEPLDHADRGPWVESIARQIRQRLDARRDTVIACSALRRQDRRQLVLDPDRVRLVFLRIGYQLALARIWARYHPFMNPALLRSQFDALQEPRGAIVVDASRPPVELVETIAAALGE